MIPDPVRTVKHRVAITVLLAVFLSSSGDALAAGVNWLPSESLVPRRLADPLEPRMGLTFAPEPDHMDVSLGAPLPVAGFHVNETPVLVSLEAGSFFRLNRDGTIFPLETFDGLVGLAVETRTRGVEARLRLMHWSAHKADGDTSVSFRGTTFSREYWSLDLGYGNENRNVYVTLGSAWHAVPEDVGLFAGLGGSWVTTNGDIRPVLAVHVSADNRRSWRVTRSALVGFETGDTREFLLGVRIFHGHSPRGQYADQVEKFAGLEIQFSL